MASKMELKTLGQKYSIDKAMMILSKIKGFKITKTDLEKYLKNKTVVKKLQSIGDDEGILNKESAIKTIFNLCSSLEEDFDTLNSYLNFIFFEVNNEYLNIEFIELFATIDADFEESIISLAEAIASSENADEYSSDDDDVPHPSWPSSDDEDDVEGKIAVLKASKSSKPAASLPESKDKGKKLATVTLKVKSSTSTSTLESEDEGTSAGPKVKKISLTSALTNFDIVENKPIYFRGGDVNFLKYVQKDLEKIYNKNAILLIIDIETCKDTIYPVSVDLNPNSSMRDILKYIGKVLKDAASKSLKCHTDLHVYKIADLINTDRILYLNIKKL